MEEELHKVYYCELMLRVVYKENEKILIIAVYPCGRERCG
jgi:thiaminase